MFKIVILICICLLNGLLGNQIKQENENLMQCNELSSHTKQQDFESIFRTARKRPTGIPRAVTFRTDIGYSKKLVIQLGGTRKAQKWVTQVIERAKKHF
jgi:hypothetical protein